MIDFVIELQWVLPNSMGLINLVRLKYIIKFLCNYSAINLSLMPFYVSGGVGGLQNMMRQLQQGTAGLGNLMGSFGK